MAALELTGSHFIPTLARPGSGMTHKYARDVVAGDVVWVLDPPGVALLEANVVSVTPVVGHGLYNPFTRWGWAGCWVRGGDCGMLRAACMDSAMHVLTAPLASLLAPLCAFFDAPSCCCRCLRSGGTIIVDGVLASAHR